MAKRTVTGVDKIDEAVNAKSGSIPLLTLDRNWHVLFDNDETPVAIRRQADKLNDLIKRQGKLTTESKDIRHVKKRLMDDILPMVNELGDHDDPMLERKLDESKRLIKDCNTQMSAYKEELSRLPSDIADANAELMRLTMQWCKSRMDANTRDIEEAKRWVNDTRVELKKRIVRMQESEQENRDMYTYMHTIYGSDTMDILDLKYNPKVESVDGEPIKDTKKAK